jgi:hypothetical protein
MILHLDSIKTLLPWALLILLIGVYMLAKSKAHRPSKASTLSHRKRVSSQLISASAPYTTPARKNICPAVLHVLLYRHLPTPKLHSCHYPTHQTPPFQINLPHDHVPRINYARRPHRHGQYLYLSVSDTQGIGTKRAPRGPRM